jgi:hypothetical protein
LIAAQSLTHRDLRFNDQRDAAIATSLWKLLMIENPGMGEILGERHLNFALNMENLNA